MNDIKDFAEDEEEIVPIIKYGVVKIEQPNYGADDLAYSVGEFNKTVAADPDGGYHLMEYTYIGNDRYGRVLLCSDKVPGLEHDYYRG